MTMQTVGHFADGAEIVVLEHAKPTLTRKGWASLASVAKHYRLPDGRWLRIRAYEDLDAFEKAWDEASGLEHAAEMFVERTGGGTGEPGDPIAKARHAEAVAFIRDYTGRFAFILDLRARNGWGTKWYKLSPKQVEAVLKVKANDAPKPERKQTGRDLNALPYGRTCAAVDNDSGGLTFLLIDRPAELDRFKQPNRWAGWVFVKQQQGPEEVRLGSQRPGESYSGQWANLIDKVLADPEAAVRRYGTELGVCGICQLPLTNEESRTYGIGPVCRRKLAESAGLEDEHEPGPGEYGFRGDSPISPDPREYLTEEQFREWDR